MWIHEGNIGRQLMYDMAKACQSMMDGIDVVMLDAVSSKCLKEMKWVCRVVISTCQPSWDNIDNDKDCFTVLLFTINRVD